MAEKDLYELSRLNNVNLKATSISQVAVYEDHRTLINVLFQLSEAYGDREPFDLIMFDNHDDFCHVSESVGDKLEKVLETRCKRELSTIVEFDLNGLDDNWVTAGMELGLIGNVFLFNSNESGIDFRESYQTRRFGIHHMYNMGNVWSVIGHRGELNDPIKNQFRPLWDDFGWELHEGKFYFKEKRNRFVFDIDLDCFSTSILDKTVAIPEELIIERLTENLHPSYHHYYTAQAFMKELIRKSELVTLCFENGCCGGFRESHKIFNMVDYVLFDNELGS